MPILFPYQKNSQLHLYNSGQFKLLRFFETYLYSVSSSAAIDQP